MVSNQKVLDLEAKLKNAQDKEFQLNLENQKLVNDLAEADKKLMNMPEIQNFQKTAQRS